MVRKFYEDLHRIPEIAFQEFATADYVENALKQAGYEPHRIGKTCVYADLVTDPQLPWVVLRSDMDALAVTEQTDAPYASQNPGMMHACGHDAHMAMLLTAATQLKGEKLPQNIRILFQPAEESTLGALDILPQGILPENTAAIFGMHVWPGVPEGKVVVKTGPLMASCTTVEIECFGRCAHCGQRQNGADAVQTAATIVTRFHEAEAQAGGDGSILFCGSLHAGTSHNVVADYAKICGTLRTFSEDSRQKILKKLEAIAAESERTYGTQVQVHYTSYAPAVTNPPEITAQLLNLLPDHIPDIRPVLIAEDFSHYQQRCPGAFLWLGVGDTAPLHNGKYLTPQAVLPVGVAAWLKLATHNW